MRAELIETARGLYRAGIVTTGTLEKITAREADFDKLLLLKPPSGAEIVGMRERANMSQAVFARILNVGTSTLSQLEREEKRPRGAAACLLAVVMKKAFKPFCITASLNNAVGAFEQLGLNGQAEFAGGLEVDHQLMLREDFDVHVRGILVGCGENGRTGLDGTEGRELFHGWRPNI